MRRTVWLDLVIVAAIATVWLLRLAEPVGRVMPVSNDTFRDAASVENMLAGRFWDDPSLAGFSYWYAPGGPLLYAAAAKLTGRKPLELYAQSILWVNVWIPIGMYLVVRFGAGRAMGLIALLMVWLTSRWWQAHVALPMPSIQGMILVLASLAVWRVAMRGRFGWSILLGVVLAACTWHHILSAIIVSGAIGAHALLWMRRNREGGRFDALKRAGVAGAVCGVLIAPLAWHLLGLPTNNAAPMRFFSPKLYDPSFVCPSAPLVVIPLALIGLATLVRKPRAPLGWLIGYLLIGLVGQGFGYARQRLGLDIPTLLPHEFQWHGQFAIGVLAAIGIVAMSRRLGRLARPGASRGIAMAATAVALILLTAVPEAARAPGRIDDNWQSALASPDVLATMQWIKRNTVITDVFACGYLPAYYEVVARTGRKLILMPEARANVSAHVLQRRRDMHRLRTTRDPEEFLAIAVGRYGARFVYLTDEYENLVDRLAGWDIFETAYRSPSGERTILRILDARGR